MKISFSKYYAQADQVCLMGVVNYPQRTTNNPLKIAHCWEVAEGVLSTKGHATEMGCTDSLLV